jgi:Gram-negative porin
MKNQSMQTLATLTAMSLVGMPAMAYDVSVSGFGTLGYARSNQDFNYQAHVNSQGSLKRDSVLGLQLDARLSDEFAVTAQAKAAPSQKNDKNIDATVSWAFLSWRPSNDTLVRIGRLRVPLYLQSENTDVSATFDLARLPTEVYSTSPTTDFDGISASKSWGLDNGELSLDGYLGRASTVFRIYLRDTAVPFFAPSKVDSLGLALTYTFDDSVVRASAHAPQVRSPAGQEAVTSYPFVQVAPGIGYYQVSSQMPGPGLTTVKVVHSPVYTLGTDLAVGGGVRVMGEYVRRHVRNIVSGLDTESVYLSVRKSFGPWTPYISAARLKTMSEDREAYRKLNQNMLPNTFPNAAIINGAQRAAADGLGIYDQSTWSVGASYRIDPTSRLKAEWARIRTGEGSSFLDVPVGGESGKKSLNVISISYNFVF